MQKKICKSSNRWKNKIVCDIYSPSINNIPGQKNLNSLPTHQRDEDLRQIFELYGCFVKKKLWCCQK